jgi:uncharacterized membrane-anchored protein
MRTAFIWLGALFIFGNFYALVQEKKSLRENGLTIFLHLAPIDPRDPLQGDYMALRYEIAVKLEDTLSQTSPEHPLDPNGRIVIHCDQRGIAEFVRLYAGGPLSHDEHLLKYSYADDHFHLGAERYFIPEGSGEDFAQAKYGEIKIAPDGTALLVALRDKDLKPLSVTAPAESR